MSSVPSALTFLLMLFAGWVNRHQLIIIEFLDAANRLLKQRLRGKRTRSTDAERALLARRAKAVGRKALLELDMIASPDTLMRDVIGAHHQLDTEQGRALLRFADSVEF